ncbi:MAG: iron-containing alcohol dehydrogenase [Rhodospirillales bacterium]|jgi:alcohol dehydrogenase|nr:iron-containing alcohol dehydrogenase [Rhodospirillales bacterium]
MTDVSRPISINHPPIIECGAGVASKVAEWANAKDADAVLVVADAFNADRVGLLGFGSGTKVEVFGDVVPEPDIANLEKLLALAGDLRPDLVVGFGGGSAMDLAKLAAVLGDGNQTLEEVVGAHLVKGRRPLLAQVPTTAGTGSEGGTRSLVTDTENARKMAVESLYMLADLVALDPQLTVSLPPAISAATGVDALAHCVESYTNVKAHPAIDIYATEGIRLIGRYLTRAVQNGEDMEARTALALASMYGGFCLGPVNTAAGHAIAYPLGTRHHLPHGHANAIIFPHVLAFNAEVAPERTALVLDALGTTAFRFCENLGIEMRMSQLGIPESDLEAMADEAFAIKRLLDNNPREVSREDILTIYKTAY